MNKEEVKQLVKQFNEDAKHTLTPIDNSVGKFYRIYQALAHEALEYLNEEISMYVSVDEKLVAIVNETHDMMGVQGGDETVSFDMVIQSELDQLRDHIASSKIRLN